MFPFVNEGPLKTGAVRSEYSPLPVFQYGALLRALKIPTVHAQTLPYGDTPFSCTLVVFTQQADWNVKSTNRHKTDSELLTNSISIRSGTRRSGISNYGHNI